MAAMTAAIIAMAAASAASSYASSKSQQAQTEAGLANSSSMNTQDVAMKESALDPFRQQMSQANDIQSLDQKERSTYTPTRLTAPAGMEQYIPQMSGGTSYTKSPEAVASFAALKRNIMAGNTAPTQTNPDNYGKTSVLNLLNVMGQQPNLKPYDPASKFARADVTPWTDNSVDNYNPNNDSEANLPPWRRRRWGDTENNA